MLQSAEYAQFFVALLVIIDPFMAAPVFVSYTRGYSVQERRRTAVIASLTVFATLALTAFSGEALLRTLGTSLGSFRVGGGIVLFLMALAMLKVQSNDAGLFGAASASSGRASAAVVPLAIPLLAGPGALSTAIIGMSRASGAVHASLIVAAIAGASLVLWLVLRAAGSIDRALGPLGLDVANRLFGLLLAAIATEMVAAGLRQLFPVLAG